MPHSSLKINTEISTEIVPPTAHTCPLPCSSHIPQQSLSLRPSSAGRNSFVCALMPTSLQNLAAMGLAAGRAGFASSLFKDRRSRSALRFFLSFHTALRCCLEHIPSLHILCGALPFIRSSLLKGHVFSWIVSYSALISPHLCLHSLFLFFLFQTNIKANTTSRAPKPPTFKPGSFFLNEQRSLQCEIPFMQSPSCARSCSLR